MDFGDARKVLKAGGRVKRAGWNSAEMWLTLIENWTVDVSHAKDVAGLLPLVWIGVRTENRCFGPWEAPQADLLAEDWEVV